MNSIFRAEILLFAVAAGLLIFVAFHYSDSFDSRAFAQWFVDIA